MRYPFRAVLGTVLLPLIIFLSTLFGATPVEAGTANLTWVAPTTRTDGAALTGPLTFKVYRGSSAAGVAASTTAIATATGTSYTDTSAPAGTQFYAVTAVDAAGVESAKTNAVSVVIPVAPPSPPTGLSVVAVIAGTNLSPVFRLDERGRRAQFAGLIEAGATCTGPELFRYRGVGYRRVASKDVDVWYARATARVAAACRTA